MGHKLHKLGSAAQVRDRDRQRYAAYAAAASDPEVIMGAVEAAFSHLHRLTAQNERTAVAGAAALVTDRVLQLCLTRARSAVQAENQIRFVAIMARWSFTRDPVLSAVLEASRRDEEGRWGLDDSAESRIAASS